MKTVLCASALLIFSSIPSSAVELYGAQGVPGGRLDLFLRGFVDDRIPGTQGAGADNIVAAFDWTSSSASLQSFDFVFSGGAYVMSRMYTTGPGQTKTITATVNVNPFTLTAATLPQYHLTPGVNGVYDVTTPHPGAFNSLPLSGTVVISGPTQSAVLPFSVSIPTDPNIPFPSLNGVGTSAYPTTLSLDFFQSPYYGGGVSLAYWFVPDVFSPFRLGQATVDGIDVDILTIGGYASTFSSFNLHAVPEPSASLLALFGTGSLIWRRRRTAK